MNKIIWITWENQVRNKSMAKILGARLFVINCKRSRMWRYCSCMLRTMKILLNERPTVVFCQNPSIVLLMYLLFMKMLFRYRLVSDAHFAGVIAYNGNKLLQLVLNLCNRLVDLVIVTTPDHARYIRGIGGESIVCEDPLPDLSGYCNGETVNDKNVLFICSFDVDEPYEKVFAAADKLSLDGFRLCVSGNFNKVNINPLDYPSVVFLGFLPEAEYHKCLMSSSVVIDLTENENCLVCGAYEAMSAEKPLVTSRTSSLMAYFTKGTVFTRHDTMSIVNAVKNAYEDRAELIKEIKIWKLDAYSHQLCKANNILDAISTMSQQ